MKPVYVVSIEDDEVGEVQGMFDEDFKLIDYWSLNDANWRSEYFEGILNHFGYEGKSSNQIQRKILERDLKNAALKGA